MAERVELERRMERLERDLRYFKLALEGERDPHRRLLLLTQIRNVEVQILALVQETRAQVQRENRFMQEALARLEEAQKSKDNRPDKHGKS